MKYIPLLLFFLLCSCGSVKIKELKDDYTQPLVGKVKSIHATIYEYRIIEKDTSVWSKSHVMEFDRNNLLVKETKTNEHDTTELNYKYTNGLVTEMTSPEDKNNYKTVFTYDSNQNCIEEKAFNDIKIFRTNTKVYDEQNNPIEEKRLFFGSMKHSTKTTYNYKQKTIVTEKLLDTLYMVKMKTKMNFNKNGFITRSEIIKENAPNNFDQYKIDKAGNLIQKTSHYSDGTIKETFSYKNTYDKTGNIITRKKFYNGKLVGETVFDITYW